MTRGWMITLAAVTALAMVSTGAAQVAGPTVCNFTGTADFTPSVLRATPSPGPIPFAFSGPLTGCQGTNPNVFNNATVSASGTLGAGASCEEAVFTASFTVTTTVGTCSGTINQGSALAGVASSVPVPIVCPAAAGTAAFQLEFLTTGGSGTLVACATTGVSTIPFSGLAETVF